MWMFMDVYGDYGIYSWMMLRMGNINQQTFRVWGHRLEAHV